MPSISVTGLTLPTEDDYAAFCDALERTVALVMNIQLGWCIVDVLASHRSRRGETNTVMIRLITGLFEKIDYQGAPPNEVSEAIVKAAQEFRPDREFECMIVHVVSSESAIVHPVN